MATTLHIPPSSYPPFQLFESPRTHVIIPPPPAAHPLPRIARALERYHHLDAHEHHLVQQLSYYEAAPASLVRLLASELNTILAQKVSVVKSLMDEEGIPPPPPAMAMIPSAPLAPLPIKRSPSPPPTIPQPIRGLSPLSASSPNGVMQQPVLSIEEQPSGNVVANKYLEPPLVAKVDDSFKDLAREGKLQVAACLCLTLTDEVLSRTLDNKQDILQGHTVVPVSGEGYATFNKLKIMEVSSKHHHQAFSIQLQLQQTRITPVGSDITTEAIPISDPIKLAPLHVQSRINKRKRSCFGHGRPRKRARGDIDCNYVDITSLLVLPQKEAAVRLGISESMLCKRFKECTRRKWPYRYLRKIDKMIRYLTLNKKSDIIPKEDQEKIQRLKREREECLHPVKIRITGSDKVGARRAISQSGSNEEDDMEDIEDEQLEYTNEGKVKDPSDSESETSLSSPRKDELATKIEEDDEIAQVASTLNLLKQGGL